VSALQTGSTISDLRTESVGDASIVIRISPARQAVKLASSANLNGHQHPAESVQGLACNVFLLTCNYLLQ
jgi:hypothetical protein